MSGFDKSTDGGATWVSLNVPVSGENYLDMSILNIDTAWLATSEPVSGGVFRTTNGGVSWTQQLALGNLNPNKIYMYNARIGYICRTNSYTRKTTDGGASWFVLVSNEAFTDMYFIDSLTGWRAYTTMKKTTDGGLSWVSQTLPSGGIIGTSQILKFSNINRDTIWGVGGDVQYPNFQPRGLLYRTTNGGDNWVFQVPDTSINIVRYLNIQFINKNIGWAYGGPRGIHTTNGGDTTFLTGVQQISNMVPQNYKLIQNYPNPFNPKTIIKYQILKSKYVNLKIYDITGKEIADLVNTKQNPGTYQVDFSGNSLSSGVYFYTLIIDGNIIDTKKMILIK